MFLIPVVFLCSGCLLLNTWLVKGDGKDLKGNYQMAGGNASNVDIVFARTLLITTQKVNKELLESLPSVRTMTSNETRSVEIGKEK